MLMTLTLILPKKQKIDIQVNQDQILKDTLIVLMGKGLFPLLSPETIIMQSERMKKRLNIELSYEENRIYTGDILTTLEIGALVSEHISL